jgi:ATP-dependent Clp protease adaptor protein ClpS
LGKLPRFGELPAWNTGAGVIMIAHKNPHGRGPIMTTIAKSNGASQILSVSGSAPRMADDDRKRKSGEPGGPGTAVITKTKPQTKKPNFYRVLILNDDYTPMEFVVHVLEKFFSKDNEAATRIMLHVHHHGLGECGVYTYEVAETKVTQVMDFARKHQHPLQCVMEKK